jgi:hypothetical protein
MPSSGEAAPTGQRFEIDFRAGGRGQEYLIAGWSHPEPDYIWTLGKLSVVRLAPLSIEGDGTLNFRCGPMVRPGVLPYQRLFVTVNGVLVAGLVCRGPVQYELSVPAAALSGAAQADITFLMPDARSPKELGGSGDSRDLGIWMSSLQFGPLEAYAVTPTGDGDRAMLMAMQSLGANCELGFVQRSAGAEPLGLFRWAYTPLPNLLSALTARFEGLGAPENLAVELDDASEFHVVDRRFGFRNHSWAYQNTGARREDILKRETVRLPYLARLLVEELEGAQKLFCFHDAGRSGFEGVESLLEVLGRYGPNWLLWIRPAGEGAPAGTAKLVGERLIEGYLDQFQPVHNVRAPSIESWMRTLREAYIIWQSAVSKAGSRGP